MKKQKNIFKAIYLPNFKLWLEKNQFANVEVNIERSTGGHFRINHIKGKTKPTSVVIVLHSTGCDRFMPLIELYKHLLSSEIDVIGLDLDGHGIDSTSIFDYSELLDPKVSHILEDLFNKHRLEYENIHLIGQSLGGCYVVDYLTRRTVVPQVRKAALVGMPVSLDLRKISVLKESFDFISPTLWISLFRYGFPGVVPIPPSARRRRFPIRTKNNRNYLSEILGYINGLDIASIVKSTQLPVLNVYGGLDTISQGVERLNSLENFSGLKLPSATHYSILYSDDYFEPFVEFLNQ